MIFGIDLKHKHKRNRENQEKIWKHGVRMYKISLMEH